MNIVELQDMVFVFTLILMIIISIIWHKLKNRR